MRIAAIRNVHRWIVPYLLGGGARTRRRAGGRVHLHFCFVDHYEPFWNGAPRDRAIERVRRWVEEYPEIASRHRDADGKHPVHTLFYPVEQYDPEILDELAGMCRRGFGEVEVHLHHDRDTPDRMEAALREFVRTLHDRHRLLRREGNPPALVYGFIHGNWTLGNPYPDGRHCGVSNELSILKKTGCYADFTFPSAPSDTQTGKINALYFANDRNGGPNPHARGCDAAAGNWRDDDLLMIQGPLCLNWKSRKFGVLPRIENGEVSHDNPADGHRVDMWIKCGISVAGRPDHVFVKVYTHGAEDDNIAALLRGNMETLWSILEGRYNDGEKFVLHYVTAYEMYRKIRELAGGNDRGKGLREEPGAIA